MELADLTLFLAVTRHGNLQSAADEVHLTPSALSRALRRLEAALRTPLFDRSGRSLKLNADGERLRQRAIALMDLAEQTRAEFRGNRHRVHCRLAAPAVLAWAFSDSVQSALLACGPMASIDIPACFEDEAIARLHRGEAELALISGEALRQGQNRHLAESLERRPLRALRMQLVCGASHGLAQRRQLSVESVLDYDFVVPTRSLFCGLPRGRASDGWREDRLPRRIRYWVDDLQLMLDLVSRGAALAYLPAFAVERCGLRVLSLEDCPYVCEERVWLLWRPAQASGWLRRFVDSFCDAEARA